MSSKNKTKSFIKRPAMHFHAHGKPPSVVHHGRAARMEFLQKYTKTTDTEQRKKLMHDLKYPNRLKSAEEAGLEHEWEHDD